LTTGCAQCHSHKYDPISHQDYYSLMALLNNADEPDLIVPDKGVLERRKKILSEIEQLQNELPGKFPIGDGSGSVEERRHHRLEQSFSEWLQEEKSVAVQWTPLLPNHLESNLPKLEMLEDGSTFSSGDITKRDVYTLRFPLASVTKNGSQITALKLEVLPDDRLPARGPGRAYYEGRKGDFFLSEFTARMKGQELKFKSASHSYGKISIGNGGADAANVIDGNGSTGWSTSGQEGKAHHLVLVFSEPIIPEGELEIEMLFERHFAASLGRFRISATSRTGAVSASRHPARILSLLVRGPSSLSDSERKTLKSAFLDVTSELAEARKQIEKLRKQLPEFPTTMVMLERPPDNPRLTHLRHRGEYLSPREVVSSGIPSVFVHADSGNLPTNRLELARWLASRKNPLAARVTVNRAWRAFFGAGLVRTSGDFGTQSDPPTHPELLDWLACEFMDQDWSLKKLHRLIVSSATYRQSSNLTELKRQQDPENRYLSRSSRGRVDAETVRDLLLSGSGLLSEKMYGPSVYPPQPSSVTALAYGNTKWNSSTGEDRYRRSLYTFSKRTAPFAAFSVFDAPSGEICVARRDRSNTPLQALTLLNDEMFIEMARELAQKAMDLELPSPSGRAMDIFRRLLIRPPSESETKAMVEFQQTQLSRLSNGELNALHISGQEQASDEQASWVMVARAVMNLDETITKQ
ncbi:MAG TPA: DUF1553 domain-containing protein, partial [Verrucomicrobia bacterium]|nr:DUF1553 domain-containing protein [Verrucomicrobiota bacterium]